MYFFFLLALLTGLTVATNKDVCRKFPAVNNAVNKICSNTKLVIPSNSGGQGATSNDHSTFVQIVGTCSPPQWVPQKYCFEQFGDMCFSKVTVRNYGRNKCQTWKINVAGSGTSANVFGGKAGT